MADQFLLRVTAGPSYDPSTHQTLPVNSLNPIHIETSSTEILLNLRIKNYRGLPRGTPSTAPYFSHPLHARDQYSISFSLLPKSDIPGTDLVFGNDFDRPIRDRLPPGFSSAFRIVKWIIDPGLDGDPYADEPWLYGPVLSSMNMLRVGEKKAEGLEGDRDREPEVVEEGADGDGVEVREKSGMPAGPDARKKWFLEEAKRKSWTFEKGRVYRADFFNPFLDFNEFALKLPGFSLSIIRIWNGPGGDRAHTLRYVLKNKATGEVCFVVVFTVYRREEIEREEAEQKDGPTPEKGKGSTDGKGKKEDFGRDTEDEGVD
ncbi:MAG: hypothetical protein M1833_005985 [Piccolia ochrophora]|nr:MAG: hypothetical protein M1833_005985 [Piccolia ochrophora]